jgi:hypothetical protein
MPTIATNQDLASAVAILLKLGAGISAASPELQQLKASAEAFASLATAHLPANADGTPISDEQLDAMRAGNHDKALAILGGE